MVTYSSSIVNLPWNEDFSKECENILIKEIYPSILDIQEEVKSNRYLNKLAASFVNDPLEVGSATGLGFLISGLSALSTISTVAIGLTAGTAVAIGKSISKWKNIKKDIEKNQLYFYYKAQKKLQ